MKRPVFIAIYHKADQDLRSSIALTHTRSCFRYAVTSDCAKLKMLCPPMA